MEKRRDLGGRGAARARRCAGLFLGGITGLTPERLLAFFGSELCAVESLRAVDAHTCVATFVLEHGARCLRHQPQHLLFTADAKLCAFEVLEFATQARKDLYVRWATPTPPEDGDARLEALKTYLERYASAQRVQSCGRPGRGAAKPKSKAEYDTPRAKSISARERSPFGRSLARRTSRSFQRVLEHERSLSFQRVLERERTQVRVPPLRQHGRARRGPRVIRDPRGRAPGPSTTPDVAPRDRAAAGLSTAGAEAAPAVVARPRVP